MRVACLFAEVASCTEFRIEFYFLTPEFFLVKLKTALAESRQEQFLIAKPKIKI